MIQTTQRALLLSLVHSFGECLWINSGIKVAIQIDRGAA
ncbi:hypothetical protein Z948_892 [Sulfitobacter donghicola DSW-25 = KCTC 12864 = JCM 14565]|nr:hypothetical protein Z948_892 [Sulfitobacter donghicola DSW-25 = KCTC 12864 = JCM 14565]